MWAPPDLSPGIGSLRPEGGHEPRLPAPSQLSLQGPRCQSGSHSSGGSFQKPFSILFRFHFWAPGCWMALALEVETDLPPWGDQVGHGVSRKVSQHPSCDSLHLSVSFHGNKISLSRQEQGAKRLLPDCSCQEKCWDSTWHLKEPALS